jgi:UDP:flavonoid glycosyltransferase YjiC (YdhE family)
VAEVLFVLTPRRSLLNQSVELARRLRLAGHRTGFAGPEGVRQVVEAHGGRWHRLETEPEWPPAAPPGLRGLVEKGRRWWERARSFGTRRMELARGLVDGRYDALLADVDPDLVLVDIELQAYVVVSAACGRRTATLSTFISLREAEGLPPLHTDIQPGGGLLGTRLGIRWAWLRYRVWKAWRHLFDWIKAPGSDPISLLRKLAGSVGFPRREIALYDWLFPFSFRTIPNLNLNPIEFDFPHVPHPTQRHTGPLVPPRRAGLAEGEDGRVPPVLEPLLKGRPPHRRLVYCAFGTAFTGDDGDFLERLVEAVSTRPDWNVLIAMGGRTSRRRPPLLPDHVHLRDWVPQVEVLARADCAVLHAGPASIYECIELEVPMVLYPFAVNDQPGYAARAGYHGIALVGSREGDDPDCIRRRIEEALSDARVLEAVRGMREKLRWYSEESVAARVVEELLDQPEDRSSTSTCTRR